MQRQLEADGHPTATTSTSPPPGWLQTPGQPYAPTGTLSVCVDYKNGSGIYYNQTLSGAQNNSFAASPVVLSSITIPKSSNVGTC